MTNTDISIEERKKLKDEIAKKYEIAMYFQNNFKHIKWHTVDEFWTILGKKLKGKLETDNGKEITKITHYQRNGCLKIIFNEMYVCYDDKGLTFGNITLNKWKEFNDSEIQKINFIDFDNKETFSLINKSNMNTIINTIIEEIKQESDDNFKNMKTI